MNTGRNDAPRTAVETPLAECLIRDLVEAHPDTLAVLGPLGIDLCCGGGHPLGEALDLHGIPREPTLAAVAAVVSADHDKRQGG